MVTALILLILSTSPGVIIVDNILFYGSDHRMRVLNTGDVVDILEYMNDRLKVEYDSVTGELEKSILIDLNDEIAEDEQFVFSRGYFDEGEFEKASRLLEIFVKFFDASDYLAEALYYLGQSYEALANRGGADSIPVFSMNTQIDQRYYNGDAYRILVKTFPESPFAAKAQYRLINIFRISNLPWNDSVDIIHQELAMWDDFCEQYQHTDEYMLALSERGYLYRVLYELTEDIAYRDRALSTFQEIIFGYPNTIHAAYAKVHLYELERDEKIYKY
jgi:outer membrane protein assembly factor BamD (BamD/ComL family)